MKFKTQNYFSLFYLQKLFRIILNKVFDNDVEGFFSALICVLMSFDFFLSEY